jgi:hypothetical protein
MQPGQMYTVSDVKRTLLLGVAKAYAGRYSAVDGQREALEQGMDFIYFLFCSMLGVEKGLLVKMVGQHKFCRFKTVYYQLASKK